MKNTPAIQIKTIIEQSQNILINTDTRTDIDALSTAIVFKNYLLSLNKDVTIIHANAIKKAYKSYFDVTPIKEQTDISTIQLSQFDLIVFLDSGTDAHVSTNPNFLIPQQIPTLNMDHHSSNQLFATYNYVYHYGSCATVLNQFFEEIGYATSIDDKYILATGLLTDVGFFKYDSVRKQDYEFAADLTASGVKLYDIIAKLSGNETVDQIRYKQIVYKNLKIETKLKAAYSSVSLEEVKQQAIDMENVFVRHSDLIKSIDGTNFCFVVAQVDANPPYIELSFRASNDVVDMTTIAARFGGGGHKGAAGAKVFDTIDINTVINRVLAQLKTI